MIRSLPFPAREDTSVLRAATRSSVRFSRAMQTRAVIAVACFAVCAGVALSVVLVPDWRGMWGAGLAVLMVAIAVIDARRFIIPDELTAAALVLGLAYAAALDPDAWLSAVAWTLARGAAPAAVFFAVRAGYRRWRGRDGIGLGDVKLAAVAGIWLDWPTIPVAVDIAAVAALGVYLILHIGFRRAVRRTTRLPFGLFLAPSIWLAWMIETVLLFYPTALSF
jgi:leader peptidase (prepilin peptidase) / N-methyltransferase